MTIIFGTLKDVGGQLSQGTVTVSSVVTRPAHGDAATVITEERHNLPLNEGTFVSPELDPGPTRIRFRGNGSSEEWQVLLPEDGRHDLATLIETHVDYAPSVVGRVEAAAADANRAAQAAGQSATRAAQAEAKVITVVADGAAAVRAELLTEIDGASHARVDAQAAQAAAEAAASRAAADARAEIDPLIDVAAGHEAAAEESAQQAKLSADASRVDADRAATVVATAAGQVRMEMQGYVNAATISEVNAAGSAQASANSAGESLAHADRAKGHADSAAQTKIEIDTTAEQVARDRDAAAASATTASGHATTAGEARAGAETARDEAVQAAEAATMSTPVGGWTRQTLSSDVRDSLTRADTALTSVPRATGLVPGGVQLAGDLGGTWDAPTVPKLAAKADKAPSFTTPSPELILTTANTGAPVNIGAGGNQWYKAREANGVYELYYRILFGADASDEGGHWQVELPRSVPAIFEVTAPATFQVAGSGTFTAMAYITPGSSVMKWRAPASTSRSDVMTMRSWDGVTPVSTSFPQLSGGTKPINARYSYLAGSITIPLDIK